MINKALRLIIITAVFITVSSLPDVCAQSQLPREYLIKAGFLYNFAKFVEWPEEVFKDSSIPITIGILGEDPFGSNLDRAVRKKTAQGRSLLVKRFKTIDDLKPCHILFIKTREKEALLKTTAKLKDLPVLTVSEIEGFTQLGGIVKFYNEGNRICFEINVDEAERAGLVISSHLLKLAKVVRNKP